MKLKLRPTLLTIALIGVGLLVFAILKSSSYSAPKAPALTQQSVKAKLVQTQAATSPKKNVPVATKPISPAPRPAATTKNLSNTGPGEVIGIFLTATILGYGFWYIKTIIALDASSPQ